MKLALVQDHDIISHYIYVNGHTKFKVIGIFQTMMCLIQISWVLGLDMCWILSLMCITTNINFNQT